MLHILSLRVITAYFTKIGESGQFIKDKPWAL